MNYILPVFFYIVLSGFNEAIGTYYQPLVYIPFMGIMSVALLMNVKRIGSAGSVSLSVGRALQARNPSHGHTGRP